MEKVSMFSYIPLKGENTREPYITYEGFEKITSPQKYRVRIKNPDPESRKQIFWQLFFSDSYAKSFREINFSLKVGLIFRPRRLNLGRLGQKRGFSWFAMPSPVPGPTVNTSSPAHRNRGMLPVSITNDVGTFCRHVDMKKWLEFQDLYLHFFCIISLLNLDLGKSRKKENQCEKTLV